MFSEAFFEMVFFDSMEKIMKPLILTLVLFFGLAIFLFTWHMGVLSDLIEGGKAIFSIVKEDVEDGISEVIVPTLFERTPDLSLESMEEEVSAPPPLRAFEDVADAVLTPVGVLDWTNSHRALNGLPPLFSNAQLNSIANMKAEDMIEKQYFAHISPGGLGAADVAREIGYEYISIGENLALGNYADDETLVQAWMDSPGHRKNILDARYKEIGIAVKKGLYEDAPVWFAVQTFGLSIEGCNKPDETLEASVTSGKAQLKGLEKSLTSSLSEIENMQPKNGAAYNQKVREYNNLVGVYNSLLADVEILVGEFNAQVNEFNVCVR